MFFERHFSGRVVRPLVTDRATLMNVPELSLRRAGTAVGYLALGVAGTTLVAVGLLLVTRPVQPAIYRALYLPLGPTGATRAAVLTGFFGASVVSLGAVLLAGDYLSDRLANRDALARAVAATLALELAFLAVTFVGLTGFLPALAGLAVALVAVPAVLYYRYEVRSGAVPAFVGGVPVLVLLVVAAGFGLGWGWGYTVTAEAVPEGTVNGTTGGLDDAPSVRDDLFDPGNCEGDGRACHLELRGYEHERTAVRALARHGVRCPYGNVGTAGDSGAFVTRHDGRYYRVSCAPHGD